MKNFFRSFLILSAALILGFVVFGSCRQAMAHEHHPPHQGTLVELGEEFSHVELVLDKTSGQLTAYALDGEAENPVRLSQSGLSIKVLVNGRTHILKLKPIANALTGETVGDTSQYQATWHGLLGVDHFEGYVAEIRIKGESFKNVHFLYPEGNENLEKK